MQGICSWRVFIFWNLVKIWNFFIAFWPHTHLCTDGSEIWLWKDWPITTDNHTNSSLLNFYRPAAFPDAQPTVLKHWSHIILLYLINKKNFAACLSSYRSCFCADCRQCYPTLRQKSSNDVLLTQCLHFTARCTATGTAGCTTDCKVSMHF